MRFPQDICALIHEKAPNAVVIDWPLGSEPEKRRVYYLQKDEEIKEREERAKNRRAYSPETHAEVMAQMEGDWYGRKPRKVKRRRRSSPNRPKAGDPQIIVLDTEIQERGWKATVALYVDPDPVRHTGLKTRVRGTAPKEDQPILLPVVTETEQEEMVTASSRREREDSEDAFVLEHRISVDAAEVGRVERRMTERRRRGRGGKLAQEALERAKRRVALSSAGGDA